MDIKAGSEGKDASIYHAINLEPALELIQSWEKLFLEKSNDVKECKK